MQQQVHPHLHSHQKSASFGSNLYQQSTNHFAPQPAFQPQVYSRTSSIPFFSLIRRFFFQQGYAFPPRLGMPTMLHNNPTNASTPTLQNPPSAFTHDQVRSFNPFPLIN